MGISAAFLRCDDGDNIQGTRWEEEEELGYLKFLFSFFFLLFSTTLGGDMISSRGEGISFFFRRSDRRGPGSMKFPF